MATGGIQARLRVRHNCMAWAYWAIALTAVRLRFVHPEDAANWYVRKALRIEVVEP